MYLFVLVYTLYVLVLGSSFSKHYTTTVYIVGDLEEWRRVEGGVGGGSSINSV